MDKNLGGRIAKNTMFLYVRMLFSMVVALYSSRVALQVLGVEGFGLYTIVGGVVTMFAFFNAAMSNATQRFFSFEIGRQDFQKLTRTFGATFNIHVIISLIILVLAETVGLWFVNSKLNFPFEQVTAVNVVYQFSIFTFLIGVLRVPFNAMIIANERMIVYSYLTIFEVFFKLLAIFLLFIIEYNKLELYAALIFSIALVISLVYVAYCIKNFKSCKFSLNYDKFLYGVLLGYSGWNLFGNIAAVAKGQGTNVLLNMFFVGTSSVLNASYGVSIQVQSALNLFVSNFQLAVNPQIIKFYADNNLKAMEKLIIQSSKLSFFLMSLIAIPILFEVDFLMNFWLDKMPKFTPLFVFFIAINLLIDSLSGPLMTGVQATGKIKYYQIVVGGIVFLNLPVSVLVLNFYLIPEMVFYVSIFMSVMAFFARLYFAKKVYGFAVFKYLTQILFRVFPVFGLCLLLPYFIHESMATGLLRFIVLAVCSGGISILLMILLGTDKSEKEFVKSKIFRKR